MDTTQIQAGGEIGIQWSVRRGLPLRVGPGALLSKPELYRRLAGAEPERFRQRYLPPALESAVFSRVPPSVDIRDLCREVYGGPHQRRRRNSLLEGSPAGAFWRLCDLA